MLYQAAFTIIARRHGERRRGAMTILTLVGGLASTIFAPIVTTLLSITDWRTMFLLLSGTLLVTTVSLHLLTIERRGERCKSGLEHSERSLSFVVGRAGPE